MGIRVSIGQRRARLVERHRLGVAAADSAGAVGGAVDALVALHATDPVTVYVSAWARTGCSVAHVDEALYGDRNLVRMLGMRRTMFVVSAGLVEVVQAACTDEVARGLRRRLEKHLTDCGIGDGDAAGWLRSVEAGVLRALAARGGASGAQLSEDEPRLRTQLTYAPDKAYGGTANITSRVLGLLAADGHLVRGNRRGGWSSGQFEWFPADAWLCADGGAQPASEPGGVLKADAARAELARRWLLAFGPALVSDLQWWAGWTSGQTKAALAALPITEVDLDGQAGVALTGDLEFGEVEFPDGGPGAAALLPGLDPTPMGWQARSWYLGPHAPRLFDRTGNVGPTVWWQGRVVGGWAQRPTGEVVYRLLEDIGSDGESAVAAEAARLAAWLGQARVTPRFRTPLERELSA
jgi:DNA glycosylase AlkZ-like